jgi:hypothetical protein
MWCMICNHDLMDCTCPDIDQRLSKLANAPDLALRWCEACNRHQDRCICVPPGLPS